MKLSQLFENEKQKGRWVKATVGSVEVFNGVSNKSVAVNLRNYTFGDEDAVA